MVKKSESTEKKTKKSTTHVCQNCLKDFKSKDVYLALAKSEDHRVVYCLDCIEKLRITDYTPYNGVKKEKNTEEKAVKKTTKKTTAKKTTAKKTTTKKAK